MFIPALLALAAHSNPVPSGGFWYCVFDRRSDRLIVEDKSSAGVCFYYSLKTKKWSKSNLPQNALVFAVDYSNGYVYSVTRDGSLFLTQNSELAPVRFIASGVHQVAVRSGLIVLISQRRHDNRWADNVEWFRTNRDGGFGKPMGQFWSMDASSPAIAPDGKSIVYSREYEALHDTRLRQINLNGKLIGHSRPTSIPYLVEEGFARDGRYIFAMNGMHPRWLWRCDSGFRNQRNVSLPGSEDIRTMAVSGDGKRIAVIDKRGMRITIYSITPHGNLHWVATVLAPVG